MKSLRIRHTYGEEDETEMLEEEAMRHAERAIQNGDTPGPNFPTEAVAAPENAVVSISGKTCKWCGSKTTAKNHIKIALTTLKTPLHDFIQPHSLVIQIVIWTRIFVVIFDR